MVVENVLLQIVDIALFLLNILVINARINLCLMIRAINVFAHMVRVLRKTDVRLARFKIVLIAIFGMIQPVINVQIIISLMMISLSAIA